MRMYPHAPQFHNIFLKASKWPFNYGMIPLCDKQSEKRITLYVGKLGGVYVQQAREPATRLHSRNPYFVVFEVLPLEFKWVPGLGGMVTSGHDKYP
jgi:hypothetical protein